MDDEADFTKALTTGLAAAEGAARAMDEVRSVIQEAARSVQTVTNDKLSLYLDATRVEKLNTWNNNLMKNLGLEERSHIVSLHAVFVGHIVKYPDGTSRIEHPERICLVRFGVQTYPLIIEWEDNNNICNDIRALKTALSQVLRDPRVARIVRELIDTYTSETREDKHITDGRPSDNYMSLIAEAKRGHASQDIEITGDALKSLKSHIRGTISIGTLFDSYFELRIPIEGVAGIAVCKIPYADIEWAAINPSTRLSLRLTSTITWNGNELSAQ